MTRPPQVRPDRTYSLADALDDVSLWCLQRPHGTVWRVSRTVDGVWQHQNFETEQEARGAAGLPSMEKVA